MPVLRRPHDRHRDLRAQLLSARASRKRDQNRHVMMTIVASQHHNPRRPCRSSTGHSLACADRQFGSRWRGHSSIDASLFDRDNLLKHRSGLDQCARLTRHNSGTASAALKSPWRQAAPLRVPPARFPPLEAFGRRPLGVRGTVTHRAGIRNPSHIAKGSIRANAVRSSPDRRHGSRVTW